MIAREQLISIIGGVSAKLWSLGVRPGEVVLYQGPQQASALVLFWACMMNGAIFAAADEGWPEFQLAQATARFKPRLVAATSRSVGAATTVFPDAEHLWLEPESEFSDLDGLERWSARATPIEPVETPNTAPAAYLFTSGTSGAPKAVVHTRGGLINGARVTIRALGWNAGERLVNLPDPHTMSGLRNAFLAAPLGGLRWFPLPDRERPNLFALLDRLGQIRCERLVTGPLMLRQLAMLGERAPKEAFSSLKAIYCTGATLDRDALAGLRALTGAPVVDYYGLTETGGICLSQRLSDWREGDASVGYPAGCDVRLVGEDGRPVPDGEEGELQVASPQLMAGYLDDPEATAARFDGRWLKTGDLFRKTRDGRFELVGRASQFIKTPSTDRVHPEEIERVLERHAAVAEAAVFGRPDGSGAERIAALIVPRAEADERTLSAELAAFVAQHLGASRKPSHVRMVERLPRLGNGKLIRHRLQDLE